MSTIRISWSEPLMDEQKDILNDAFNVMGMQAAADEGLLPQEQVDTELARLEEKYKNLGNPTDEPPSRKPL